MQCLIQASFVQPKVGYSEQRVLVAAEYTLTPDQQTLAHVSAMLYWSLTQPSWHLGGARGNVGPFCKVGPYPGALSGIGRGAMQS